MRLILVVVILPWIGSAFTACSARRFLGEVQRPAACTTFLKTIRLCASGPKNYLTVEDREAKIRSLEDKINSIDQKNSVIEYLLLRNLVAENELSVPPEPEAKKYILLYQIYTEQELKDVKSSLQTEKNTLLSEKVFLLSKSL